MYVSHTGRARGRASNRSILRIVSPHILSRSSRPSPRAADPGSLLATTGSRAAAAAEANASSHTPDQQQPPLQQHLPSPPLHQGYTTRMYTRRARGVHSRRLSLKLRRLRQQVHPIHPLYRQRRRCTRCEVRNRSRAALRLLNHERRAWVRVLPPSLHPLMSLRTQLPFKCDCRG